jgi:hypothetical protein
LVFLRRHPTIALFLEQWLFLAGCCKNRRS